MGRESSMASALWLSQTSQTWLGIRIRNVCRPKLQIDNWRWAGVPFYLRTGKRLAKRVTEIVIPFRRTPLFFFAHDGQESRNQPPRNSHSTG